MMASKERLPGESMEDYFKRMGRLGAKTAAKKVRPADWKKFGSKGGWPKGRPRGEWNHACASCGHLYKEHRRKSKCRHPRCGCKQFKAKTRNATA